jgi:hypothetical protein
VVVCFLTVPGVIWFGLSFEWHLYSREIHSWAELAWVALLLLAKTVPSVASLIAAVTLIHTDHAATKPVGFRFKLRQSSGKQVLLQKNSYYFSERCDSQELYLHFANLPPYGTQDPLQSGWRTDFDIQSGSLKSKNCQLSALLPHFFSYLSADLGFLLLVGTIVLLQMWTVLSASRVRVTFRKLHVRIRNSTLNYPFWRRGWIPKLALNS